MSTGLISLGAGVLIGLVYALLKVRSPAPPAIALVGLLGMLVGEQITSALVSHNEMRASQAAPSQTANPASGYTRTG
ncbi:DUF1427 family protein [Franconibacter pulveris]|uniref:XapX domain-containing protein n=1 Tax=Franconibacter pulveris TaxID=435910 RepID=A0A0J8YFW1_9ENTR|nr:DUF1427 family protein [Franconibacter pulveris]KMV36404.1 XapX domain-containing protein [Franconibacter pulveris]